MSAAPKNHGWNHRQCYPCWIARRGFVVPTRVRYAEWVTCCWCGKQTNDGIFIRARPGHSSLVWCSDTQIDRTIFFSRL